MTELEKALDEFDKWNDGGGLPPSGITIQILADAALRFANLTSPETIEKGAKALVEKYPLIFGAAYVIADEWAEVVLRAVEEDE